MSLFKKKDKRTPREKFLDFLNQDGNIDQFFDFTRDCGRCSMHVDAVTDSDLFLSEGEDGRRMYVVKMHFSPLYPCGDRIYISDITRIQEHDGRKIGSKILDGIYNMATYFGFKYICLNPVASKDVEIGEDTNKYLPQDVLEKWYERHLREIYVRINSEDDVYTL